MQWGSELLKFKWGNRKCKGCEAGTSLVTWRNRKKSLNLFLHLNSMDSSLVTQTVKNLLAMHETWVQSLGREDGLEKGMATQSCILAWRIPWTVKPGGLYSPWCHKELDMTEWLTLSLSFLILYWAFRASHDLAFTYLSKFYLSAI